MLTMYQNETDAERKYAAEVFHELCLAHGLSPGAHPSTSTRAEEARPPVLR